MTTTGTMKPVAHFETIAGDLSPRRSISCAESWRCPLQLTIIEQCVYLLSKSWLGIWISPLFCSQPVQVGGTEEVECMWGPPLPIVGIGGGSTYWKMISWPVYRSRMTAGGSWSAVRAVTCSALVCRILLFRIWIQIALKSEKIIPLWRVVIILRVS